LLELTELYLSQFLSPLTSRIAIDSADTDPDVDTITSTADYYSTALHLVTIPLLASTLFPTLISVVEFVGSICCILLVEAYFISPPCSIKQNIMLSLHIRPIILMGFVPGSEYIGYMSLLFVGTTPSIMIYIVATIVAIK